MVRGSSALFKENGHELMVVDRVGPRQKREECGGSLGKAIVPFWAGVVPLEL